MIEMKYKRLSFEEREEISRLLSNDLSLREISRRLNRNPSTISRELNRLKKYRAVAAQRISFQKSKGRKLNKRKLLLNPKLLRVVREKLALCWSPEQIARYLKRRYKSQAMRIS